MDEQIRAEGSSTCLSPVVYDQFASTSLTRGPELVERWRGAYHELGGFLAGAEDCGFIAVPLLATFAVPGGTVQTVAFERIIGDLLDAIAQAQPLDGVLLALHGATVVEDYPDADGEMLRRIRTDVGPDLPIVVTLDLHANVSREMVELSTAIVMYQSNPHLDQQERGIEAAVMMARILRGEIRPVQALESPPMLIRISRQYTAELPARMLYNAVGDSRARTGIISASAAMGFPYSDVVEMGASFLAIADGNLTLAHETARWMASRAWECRADFAGPLPTPTEAVNMAARSPRGPVVLMDIGDNVGGGGPGDSTILLMEIIRQGVPNTLVILYDPEAVAECVRAGARQAVRLRVGAKTDRRHGEPVEITGRIRNIADGLYVERQIRHGGWTHNDQGVTAVVETSQEHTIVLTSRRMAPMSLEQVLSLGLYPEQKRVLVVKGVVAPRAAYDPVASQTILVDTPGITRDDPARFQYRYRRRPLYPLEPDARYPLT
jgi:microcystin degradation protein MlrC